jgi:hypothetical protein
MSKFETIQVHKKTDVVAGACNPTCKEVEAGRSRVQGQHRQYSKNLSQKTF